MLIVAINDYSIVLECHSMDELYEFIAESVIMKKFNHQNVLSLAGVSIVVENKLAIPCILLPFMVNKDLKKFLQCTRMKVDNNLEAVLEVCACFYNVHIISLTRQVP